MFAVLRAEVAVPTGNARNPLRCGTLSRTNREQAKASSHAVAAELSAHFEAEQLTNRRWYSVANLAMRRPSRSHDTVVSGERLEAAHFFDREQAALPVKGPRGRTRISLDGPRRLRLCEL